MKRRKFIKTSGAALSTAFLSSVPNLLHPLLAAPAEPHFFIHTPLCASLLFVWLAFALGQGYLAGAFGINISADIFTLNTLVLSLIVAGSALLTGALPALAMYIRARRP